MNRRDLILVGASAPLAISDQDRAFQLQVTRGDLIFSPGGKEVLRLTEDGKVVVGKDVKPDEAAREFLAVLVQLWPQYICKP